MIIKAVREYRGDTPRMGILKLRCLISALFKGEQVPGKDVFFNLMRENGLVLRKRKTRETTNSQHHFYKIVGWAVGEKLEAIHPIAALEMALEALIGNIPKGLIHHSDRGVQYCCHQYVEFLQKSDNCISMTQNRDSLENAIAERVNDILKEEWLNDLRLKDLDECKNELTRIIAFYNNKRHHMNVDMQTPSLAHVSTMKFKSRWKKREKEPQAVEKKDLFRKIQGEVVIV